MSDVILMFFGIRGTGKICLIEIIKDQRAKVKETLI